MNQPRQIFKNTVAQTISDLIARGSSILLSFLIARTLHAAGMGIYSTVIAYFGLINEATNMGAVTFLVREIAKNPSKANRYVVHFSVVGTVVSAVVLVLLWVILPYLGYSADLTTSMYIIALAIIPGTLNAVQQSVFVAFQRVEFMTYTTLVSATITIGVSTGLLMYSYGVVGLVVTFVIVQYLVMAVYFFFINRYIVPVRWEFEFSFAIRLIREIKTFAALSVLGGLLAQPEIIILSLVASEEQVGFYSAALKVSNLWLFISQIYMNNVYPVLSRSYYLEDRKFRIIQDKSIKYLLAVSLPLTVGIIATAKPIVNLLYGPGFEPSVLQLQLLACSIPLFFLSAVFWRVLVARGEQDLVLRVRIVTLFTRLGGSYLLTAPLASLGTALSGLANSLFNTVLLGFYVRRRGSPLHLLSLGWRFVLASSVMGALTWALGHQLQLWVLVPLAGVTYTVLVFLLRAFSPDDLALFRRIWQPKVDGTG